MNGMNERGHDCHQAPPHKRRSSKARNLIDVGGMMGTRGLSTVGFGLVSCILLTGIVVSTRAKASTNPVDPTLGDPTHSAYVAIESTGAIDKIRFADTMRDAAQSGSLESLLSRAFGKNVV